MFVQPKTNQFRMNGYFVIARVVLYRNPGPLFPFFAGACRKLLFAMCVYPFIERVTQCHSTQVKLPLLIAFQCMTAYVEFEIAEGAYEVSCPDAMCAAQGVLSIAEIALLTAPSLVEKHHRYRLNRGKLLTYIELIFNFCCYGFSLVHVSSTSCWKGCSEPLILTTFAAVTHIANHSLFSLVGVGCTFEFINFRCGCLHSLQWLQQNVAKYIIRKWAHYAKVLVVKVLLSSPINDMVELFWWWDNRKDYKCH